MWFIFTIVYAIVSIIIRCTYRISFFRTVFVSIRFTKRWTIYSKKVFVTNQISTLVAIPVCWIEALFTAIWSIISWFAYQRTMLITESTSCVHAMSVTVFAVKIIFTLKIMCRRVAFLIWVFLCIHVIKAKLNSKVYYFAVSLKYELKQNAIVNWRISNSTKCTS